MNNTQRITAVEGRLDTLEVTVASGFDRLATMIGALSPNEPAKTVTTSTPEAAVTGTKPAKEAPKYRSTAAKAKGREAANAIYARHYAAAGVKRFKDLTPAQQKAAKAEVAAAWKGIKGTRKTKAA